MTKEKSGFMDCIKVGNLISQLRKEKGLTQKNAVEAVLRGVKKSGFKANVILCAMRSGDDNSSENLETAALVKEFLNKGVCALDRHWRMFSGDAPVMEAISSVS